jgi:hypothetical protein
MEDAARGLDLGALREGGVAFVVVLPVPLWALQRYARERLAASPALAACVFADERALAFKALACPVKFASKKLRPDSIHAHTTVARAAWKGFLEGLRGGTQGDPRQLGLSVVLQAAPGGSRVLWAHRDAFNADQVPLPVLVAAAGLPPAAYAHAGGRRGGGARDGRAVATACWGGRVVWPC